MSKPGKGILKKILMQDFSKDFVYESKSGFSPTSLPISNELIYKALFSLSKNSPTPLIGELSSAFLKRDKLKYHWCYKSIVWNLICIYSWLINV